MRGKIFRKMIDSNRIFALFVVIFVLSLAITLYFRGGKDLKVAIYGAQETLRGESPYDNPVDSDSRPLFRYAPGFAIMVYPFILTSKMYRVVDSDLQFDGIMYSVFAWFLVKILLLFIIALLILKIIPSVSREAAIRNLKISFLMASPLIGCELSNSQNKIIALFFMVLAIWLFEEDRLFISAVCFNLALTVYFPLFIFLFYFVIRKRKFILGFVSAVFLVFFVLPSLVFGVSYNSYLLGAWFERTIHPFSFANSYATYIELRRSSQSLPSAIGRIFVSGNSDNFKYLISPLIIGLIIRFLSAAMVIISSMAVWRNKKSSSQRGLGYVIFFILALILPQYCITYTWCWDLVFYFVIFNYLGFLGVSHLEKKLLYASAGLLFISSVGISLKAFNNFSGLFWSTVLLWAAIAGIIIKLPRISSSAP
jgi:hypothetical protein